MIDDSKVTVSTYNVHIQDCYQYSADEVRAWVEKNRHLYPNCEPLQLRSTNSLLREWAAHKAAWLLHFKRERAASVDLNYPQRWWVCALYLVCGSIALFYENATEVFL